MTQTEVGSIPPFRVEGDTRVGFAPPIWGYDKRIFGGFAAGSALLAAATHAPADTVALTAHVMFLSSTTTGAFIVDPIDVRIGRSNSAVSVRLHQDGETRLTLSAWFVPTDRLAHGDRVPVNVPGPDACPPTWRDGRPNLDQGFTRRALNFPASISEFPTHGPETELWIRLVGDWQSSTPHTRQAADLMMLDAHLSEPVIMPIDADPVRSFSLDMTARWYAGDHRDCWRRLQAQGSASGRIGRGRARLIDPTGAVVVEADQNVSVGPPRAR